MDKLTFHFSVDEANKIINGLAQLPFGAVAELINNIQQQAQGQMGGMKADGGDGRVVAPPTE